MKRYKLKKDAPCAKAGTVFEERVDEFDGKILINEEFKYKIIVDCVDNFDDWLEEIPEYKRWRAEYTEEYWCIGGSGNTHTSTEDGHRVDDYRFDTGSYFKTEEEAKAYKEYIIARQVLLDDAKGGKWKKDEMIFYAYYDHDIDEWIVDSDIDNIQTPGVIYFQNREDVRKSLKNHKEQWEIVRKYEMGEM